MRVKIDADGPLRPQSLSQASHLVKLSCDETWDASASILTRTYERLHSASTDPFRLTKPSPVAFASLRSALVSDGTSESSALPASFPSRHNHPQRLSLSSKTF